MDINQILQSGNVNEIVRNLTTGLYFYAFLIIAFTGKLFSLFLSFFIGKYKRAIFQPTYYITFIIDTLITIIVLIILLSFPEILTSLGGIK